MTRPAAPRRRSLVPCAKRLRLMRTLIHARLPDRPAFRSWLRTVAAQPVQTHNAMLNALRRFQAPPGFGTLQLLDPYAEEATPHDRAAP